MVISYKQEDTVELKDQILDIVKKRIDVPGLVKDSVKELLEPALLAAVAKSETKVDDILVAAILPILEEELFKLIDAKWKELLSPPVAPGGGELV